jgi:hypothetical protein
MKKQDAVEDMLKKICFRHHRMMSVRSPSLHKTIPLCSGLEASYMLSWVTNRLRQICWIEILDQGFGALWTETSAHLNHVRLVRLCVVQTDC